LAPTHTPSRCPDCEATRLTARAEVSPKSLRAGRRAWPPRARAEVSVAPFRSARRIAARRDFPLPP
jgi:hypothetical protein